MARLALALMLVCLMPHPLAAKDAFRDLPGVKDPTAEVPEPLDVVCTSRLVRPWPSQTPRRSGLARRVYNCRSGNMAVGSDRPPNMIEYRKLKQRY